MGRFLLQRLIQSAVAILGTITLVFFIQRLAGDPTLLMLTLGLIFLAIYLRIMRR